LHDGGADGFEVLLLVFVFVLGGFLVGVEPLDDLVDFIVDGLLVRVVELALGGGFADGVLHGEGVVFEAVLGLQDGASSHNALSTKAFLRRNNICFIEDWPSHSPYLNPIEQVWAELDRRVAEKQKNVPSSVEELRAMAAYEWEHFEQRTINNYIMSFMSKCRHVRESKGGSAKE
jgi:hypothetical protein